MGLIYELDLWSRAEELLKRQERNEILIKGATSHDILR